MHRKITMDSVETELYAIRPEKYLAVMSSMFVRKYRIGLLAAAVAAVILSVCVTDFIYAVIVLAFGAFPFVLFHVYFRYAGRYDNKYLFIEKSVAFGNTSLTIFPAGEEPVHYPVSLVEYGGYAKNNHMFILDGRYMLNVPLTSFADCDRLSEFRNWLDTQIIRRKCRE